MAFLNQLLRKEIYGPWNNESMPLPNKLGINDNKMTTLARRTDQQESAYLYSGGRIERQLGKIPINPFDGEIPIGLTANRIKVVTV
jgi:hypothetical protein